MADALLQEINERFEDAREGWKEIQDEGDVDMRYVAGDPWTADDRTQRENAGRPCLALDELGQYFNQTINDLRINPRGIKFTPTGTGSNDKAAEFYENKAREIEYRSHAQVAYLTAAENMIQRSFGWVRINLDFGSPRSFDQELWIEAVPNPNVIVPDREAKKPDMSDMQYLFYYEQWRQAEFKRKFKKAKAISFTPELQQSAPSFFVGNSEIILAEYWRIVKTARRLLEVQPLGGSQLVSVFKDELPADFQGTLIRERDVEWPMVKQCLTNGVEILDETDWPGKYLPFVAALGKVLYTTEGGRASRTILSMTRLARDPYMAYCYYRTSEIENVGMVTKNPYWAYRGQLNATEQTAIQQSFHEPVAVLTAGMTAEGAPPGQLLPLPQRNPLVAFIQDLSVGAEEMRRAIQSAMGISPLPTNAQRQNDKSGRALAQIEASTQKGAFHFVDHFEGMIRQVGVVIEDLIDTVYQGPRTVSVMDLNQKSGQVRVDDPQDPKAINIQGDYQVTISAGPALESEREAADQFVEAFLSNLQVVASLRGPQVASAILAKAVQLKNLGPIGDQIADWLMPPEMQPDGEPPSPEVLQLKAALQQAQGQMQQLVQERETEAIQAQRDVALETLKQAKETERTQLQIVADREKQTRDLAAKIEIARISAAKQAADQAAEAAEERLALGATLSHEAHEHALDRVHDAKTASFLAHMEPR